jgi:hypothetical protein
MNVSFYKSLLVAQEKEQKVKDQDEALAQLEILHKLIVDEIKLHKINCIGYPNILSATALNILRGKGFNVRRSSDIFSFWHISWE